jgi:SAM-dependent methyltransferase
MRFDILDLREFYHSPLGETAFELLASRLARMWRPMAGKKTATQVPQRIAAIGYGPPYLEKLWPEADITAFMPAILGITAWQYGNGNRAALIEETALPLADNSVDRVLVVHALEMTHDPETLMQEIWRVLVPGGEVMIIVPNRSGFWSRRDITPWGCGRPFSRRQLRGLVMDAGFAPVEWTSCLAVPPLQSPLFHRLARHGENFFRLFLPQICGLTIVSASKLIYSPVAPARTPGFGLKPIPRPVLAPKLGRTES